MANISFRIVVSLDLCATYDTAHNPIENIIDKEVRKFVSIPLNYEGSYNMLTSTKLSREFTINYNSPHIHSNETIECQLTDISPSPYSPMKQYLTIKGTHYDRETFLAKFTKLGRLLYG